MGREEPMTISSVMWQELLWLKWLSRQEKVLWLLSLIRAIIVTFQEKQYAYYKFKVGSDKADPPPPKCYRASIGRKD